MPAGLALFTAFGTALARLLWARGAMRVVALAVALTIAEWLRGHLLTGFPVEHIRIRAGDAAGAGADRVADRHLGPHLHCRRGLCRTGGAGRRSRGYAAALAGARARGFVVIAGLAGYGIWRLDRTPTTFVDGVRLRLMQPNIQQDQRFNYSQRQAVMDRYAALSDRAERTERGRPQATSPI